MSDREQDGAETSFEFPCRFPIKVFGPAVPEFRGRVLALIREHAATVDDDAVRENLSRGGRYLSLTVTIEATDRAQLDAIYRALTACELVTMAL
ncbi:YbeD family protein [Acidihalobacter prosperus]|uniref:UPF0250 protein Thpro_021183 n=1 Tax=Acidihalobacter prosperus TaxID=160660 RepID=A0A1A6C6E0_9GAMM|nr:DUF493 domain-containing protein [Acidihalobacter prosperus]OBS10133.1 hypothetical protein Thpro_021183 [Acidihalobacter prosperus]